MPRTLNLAFFTGAALLAGMAWGLDGYQNPHQPRENRFLKYVQSEDPWAEFRPPPNAPLPKSQWGGIPLAAAGKDPALRHLPVFHFQHTDGWTYAVQAENAEAATAIFDSVRGVGEERYLRNARNRIIQNPFDIFDREGPSPPPLPPGFVPVPPEGMWAGSNRTDRPQDARR